MVCLVNMVIFHGKLLVITREYMIFHQIKPFGDIYPSPNHHGDVTHRHVEASLEKSSSPIPSGYVKIAIENGYL